MSNIQLIENSLFLGMHFSQAVAIIQSQVGTIRGVQVLYSDTVSLIKFICLQCIYNLRGSTIV